MGWRTGLKFYFSDKILTTRDFYSWTDHIFVRAKIERKTIMQIFKVAEHVFDAADFTLKWK